MFTRLPDARSELPSGYIWKELEGIGSWIPMPQQWFYKAQVVPGTKAFFITRESIERHGFFITGLSVNVLFDFKKRTGVSPSEYLLETLGNAAKIMEPRSEMIEEVDGPFIVRRQLFYLDPETLPPEVPRGLVMEPMYQLVEQTANDQRDKAYMMLFETPAGMWSDDEIIARTMIENRILDPNL